jgi:hypothetical protein
VELEPDRAHAADVRHRVLPFHSRTTLLAVMLAASGDPAFVKKSAATC